MAAFPWGAAIAVTGIALVLAAMSSPPASSGKKPLPSPPTENVGDNFDVVRNVYMFPLKPAKDYAIGEIIIVNLLDKTTKKTHKVGMVVIGVADDGLVAVLEDVGPDFPYNEENAPQSLRDKTFAVYPRDVVALTGMIEDVDGKKKKGSESGGVASAADPVEVDLISTPAFGGGSVISSGIPFTPAFGSPYGVPAAPPVSSPVPDEG